MDGQADLESEPLTILVKPLTEKTVPLPAK
jgi:hypothetical protein